MQKYDITIITKEDDPKEALKNIESLGGKIISKSSLGQKQLVYPIKKEKAGVYTTIIFEINPEKVTDLNKKLSLSDEILRFLIISYKAPQVPEKALQGKAEAEVPKMPEITEEAVKEAKPEESIKATKKDLPKEAPKADQIKTPELPKKELPKPVGKPVKKAVEKEDLDEQERLEALDKKLDELLKE